MTSRTPSLAWAQGALSLVSEEGRGGGGILVSTSDKLANLLAILFDLTEIEEAAQNCRYRDCRHENEPGCAVNEAVAAGKIDEKRLVNFKKMRREIERFEIRNDARLKREEEKKWKQIAKAIKNYSKETRYKF